ncbi:MAG: LuxR C-terminal-related transcriptional regulator [Lautropia sp.]
MFANQFIPDSSPAQLAAFDEIQRRTVSAEAAASLLSSFYRIDVSELAAQVRCPTLVLHAGDDARVPFEQGQRVARAIPGAQFVPLDSRNHILLNHQPAWQHFFAALQSFLQAHPAAAGIGQDAFAGLTPAERRVLDCIAAGLSNSQIAERLAVRPKTVRNHINHLFDKLGVHERSRVIVMAREAGLGRAA